MKAGVKLVEIAKLRAHEQVCPERLAVVTRLIGQQKIVVNPIIVSRQHRIILDGHHRVESLKKLGCRLVPAILVDYFSDQVKVYSRRDKIKVSKKAVIGIALRNQTFPQKTTRHLIRNRIRGVKVNLNQLK
jgi:hypothetical protein